MKKAKLLGALLCSACLTVSGTAIPTMADSMKVVTLGADLTDEQKNTMMRYFNVDSSQVQILTITNQDERDHLSAYVPLEQIGTRTVSCAYVKPTQSGGIKVRTANLNWVTCNMIATSLSTSGVKNCEVVAACPFEVSGTGALTGIQMAYETATGEKLDETKKQIATEEMVVTGNIADDVGKNDATTVINNSKMEVIKNNVQNADEIYNIVLNVAQQNNVSLDTDQINEIVNLLKQIADQGYNYDDVKATLEQVEANTSGDNSGSADSAEIEEDGTTVDEDNSSDDGDNILAEVDDSVLGGDVVASSTEDPTLEEQTGLVTEVPEENTTQIPDATQDGSLETDENEIYDYNEENTASDENGDTTDASLEENADTAGTDTEELDTSSLTEDQLTQFNKLELFCQGEYEGYEDSLKQAMEDDTATLSVFISEESATALTKAVEKAYLQILQEGTDSYVADGTEKYMSTELNMVDKAMKDLFGQNEEVQADASLSDVAEEDRQTLYNDTMKFFEKLYGESSEVYYTEEAETQE